MALINLTCLGAMVAWAQYTDNKFLLGFTIFYLSLSTIGCISVIFRGFRVDSLVWPGWLPMAINLFISLIVTWFMRGTIPGIWYALITIFWNIAVMVANKEEVL